MSRRLLLVLGAVAVVVVVVVGLSQTNTNNAAPKANAFDLAAAKRALAGAPAPLAALHEQASVLLPGSKKDVQARIEELKGHPVVVNKWASWCGPCRYEFPFLQRNSVRYGKQVAFIGLDSNDEGAAAKRFLKQFPLTYPSYVDQNSRIAQALEIGKNYPTTMYYDAAGKLQYVHQGLYSTDAALDADIRRYALGRPS
ncbi:MAG TPA: TlpA disulfide reductase family protein [Baekduia sp.]|uniref:TlpA family protein disulfide reductase n=1 Tax=Baekduia sp. TaxID=2600305 RepID=UPI002BAA7BC7|nr:TlpA disulfide reductase family protein [Baekduia sp.]HMJ33850.1 TlpA disulfide reductase family protein [Baekduia sp.]